MQRIMTTEQELYFIKHSEEKTSKEWMEYFQSKNVCTINRKLKQFNIKSKKPSPYKVTEEMKQNLSIKRKKWLSENPDKHPWRNSNKFKSVPCENVKKFLTDNNINYIEEYNPQIPTVNYSIDIALPDKLIAIEVNGNQHYENTGKLKKYYQERHNLLESNGWTVYEIHYSHCFKIKSLNQLLLDIQSTSNKNTFEYDRFQTQSKKINLCKFCSCIISHYSTQCLPCSRIGNRKIKWPEPQTLKEMIFNKPSSQVAKDLGVSDVAIGKFCKRYNIEKPPRGYWTTNKSTSNLNNIDIEELNELIWVYPITELAKKYKISGNALRNFIKNNNIKKPGNGYWSNYRPSK